MEESSADCMAVQEHHRSMYEIEESARLAKKAGWKMEYNPATITGRNGTSGGVAVGTRPWCPIGKVEQNLGVDMPPAAAAGLQRAVARIEAAAEDAGT